MGLPPLHGSPLRKTGFQLHEQMRGTHEFVARCGPPGEWPFSFELDWGCESLARFLNPLERDAFMTASCEGVMRVGGFVEEAPCSGWLELRTLTEATIRYRLTFRAGEHAYAYIGEKLGLRPWNLHRTHTTCYGVLYEIESGREISRSLARFGLETLPAFLMSFRWMRTRNPERKPASHAQEDPSAETSAPRP